MALNEQPCSACRFYDPIRNGLDTKGNVKFAVRGWCAAKSVYPFKEQEGQVFPPGVKRGKPGELGKPVIVVGSEVESGCSSFRAKAT